MQIYIVGHQLLLSFLDIYFCVGATPGLIQIQLQIQIQSQTQIQIQLQIQIKIQIVPKYVPICPPPMCCTFLAAIIL